jgi:hypothetical protein
MNRDPFGLITQHTGKNRQGMKEFADIFEGEISFGAQAGIKFEVAKFINVKISLDIGTMRSGFKEASSYTETTQDVGGSVSLSKIGFGIWFGYKRKKCGTSEPQFWDEVSKQRIGGQTIPEYLAGIPWEPYWNSNVVEGMKLSGDDLDVKVGIGAALGLGAKGYLNCSEVIDFMKWVIKTNGL